MTSVKYRSEDSNQKYYQEYFSYLEHLFCRARDTSSLQCIYTLLRVSGIEDGGWDPFIEAQEALIEFSKILKKISKNEVNKSSFRLALLIYCHSVEMSAPYHILYNLLQCIQKKNYIPFPFPGRPNKKKFLSLIPQSPVVKLAKIETECKKVDEGELIKKFNSFFDDDIRNAFYHSDYSFTNEEFRICENGVSRSVSLSDLSEKLARCFAFYQAFFDIYKRIRLSFRKSKKLHRLQGFEVMELITDNKEGLIGFKMHFSNGSQAMFQRRKERVHGINVTLEDDGINFFIGLLSSLQNKWIVNGKTFRERNTRYNIPGQWKPIVFPGDSSKVTQDIVKESNDIDVQGCLFYIRCTGHESIEFIIKSNKPLDKTLSDKKIDAYMCDCSNKDKFIYDCTYFVNSMSIREVKKRLTKIKLLVSELTKIGTECNYFLKYKLYTHGDPTINKDGSFSLSFSANDPRNTLCVSALNILPPSDWKIMAEWADD